jgi:stage II sporulation protein AB (anti-sigma F factor)
VGPDMNRLCLTIDAREENVAVARAIVASAAAQLPFTLPEVEELRIAASEAVSNAVLHAYGPAARGEIEIAIELMADAMTVRVRDWGRGIGDPEQARRPEVSTLEGHLGLGFAFMEAMSDEVSVESRPGEGTTVTLRKRAHGGEPPAAPPAGD